MRLVKINEVSNIGVFKDILDLQVVDGSIEAVTVKYQGQEMRIVVNDSYSKNLKMLMQEPKEEKSMFRVKGTYMGLDVAKEFDDEYGAKQYIIEMNRKLPYGEEHTLEIEPFSLFVERTKI